MIIHSYIHTYVLSTRQEWFGTTLAVFSPGGVRFRGGWFSSSKHGQNEASVEKTKAKSLIILGDIGQGAR